MHWASLDSVIAHVVDIYLFQIRMYGKLTIEVDRRVRLAANNVHMLIATNAKKKLAPHLKEFIGAWILTLFDQSPDVAKCAKSSFEVECLVLDQGREFGISHIYTYDTGYLCRG